MRFPACANVKEVLTEKIVTKFAAMQFLEELNYLNQVAAIPQRSN
jgi:hypothetical protein